LNTDLLGTESYFFGFGSSATLRIGGSSFAATDIKAIWARRFALPSSLQELDFKYRDFAKRELSVVMDAFLEDGAAFQINGYMADRLAGNRLIQSARAKRIGLNVPDTCVTQDKSEAQNFLRKHSLNVTKAMSFGRLTTSESDAEIVAYTSKVTLEHDLSGLQRCPALFQERIQGKYEWRVTTVGEQLFSARVALGDDEIDWRLSPKKANFEAASLPKEIERKLARLCTDSQIVYGAHDLIEDRNGDFFFLETNPAGQWGWLELTLGMPIGEAIANELCRYVD
jgi:glutathione synthase/RimK-type ligase-like ATP-grasp enzyme